MAGKVLLLTVPTMHFLTENGGMDIFSTSSNVFRTLIHSRVSAVRGDVLSHQLYIIARSICLFLYIFFLRFICRIENVSANYCIVF